MMINPYYYSAEHLVEIMNASDIVKLIKEITILMDDEDFTEVLSDFFDEKMHEIWDDGFGL